VAAFFSALLPHSTNYMPMTISTAPMIPHV